MHTVKVEEVGARIFQLIEEVGRGEEIIIIQSNQPVARLARPASTDDGEQPETAHAALLGLWQGKITLEDGWDAPLSEMEPYTR